MDFIFTDGLRGRSLTKPSLNEGEDPDMAMDSVKTPRLPELPNVLHTDLSHSVGGAGVRRFLIDNPKDQELKKREQLWQFHRRNRGAMVRLKGLNPVLSKSTEEKLDGLDSDKKTESDNEEEKSPRETRKFPKIRSRLKMESRNSNSSNGDKKETKETNKDPTVKYTYSSALTIGNSIYCQLRGKEQEPTENTHRPTVDSGRTKRAIVNSIDKLPDLSNALTKLGYMKLTRNVVHFGGGFFGRHQEKRYSDLRRSMSSLDTCSRPEVTKTDKGLNGSMNQLESMVETSRIKFETPRTQNKSENKSVKENQVQKTDDCVKSEDDKTSKPLVSEPVKKPLVEKQETPKSTNVNVLSERSHENQKPNGKSNRMEEEKTTRPSSDISLDIPRDKYGPSSQMRDVKSYRTYWGPACGLNPYRWTNKNAITDEDKTWVEQAMQKTDVIDQTAYDCFARTKPPKS